MKLAHQSMEVIRAMAETGNPNSVTDAGVAALCARTAVFGAYLNVKINATGYHDKTYTAEILVEGDALQQMTIDREAEILDIVNNKNNRNTKKTQKGASGRFFPVNVPII